MKVSKATHGCTVRGREIKHKLAGRGKAVLVLVVQSTKKGEPILRCVMSAKLLSNKVD